jgi:putative ABC transport system ATP-binding protein
MNDNGTMIRLSRVAKSYRRGGETVAVLDHLDLEMVRGGFYALMGPSGSGKTTLLNLVGGLDHADSGEVVVAGQDLGALDGADLARWRAEHVGFVFQQFNLLSVLTALENVELPLLLAPLSRKERREHARHALELVGLADRLDHRPAQLSGGQEQRVAIARAIASDPQIILADEPTGDLDRHAADQVMDLFRQLHEQFGKTILIVTHDPLAAARAERIVHLDKGRLTHVEEKGKGSGEGAAR